MTTGTAPSTTARARRRLLAGLITVVATLGGIGATSTAQAAGSTVPRPVMTDPQVDSPTVCAGTAYVATSSPTLRAVASGPTSAPLLVTFEVRRTSDGVRVARVVSDGVRPGSSAFVESPALADGTYTVRVRGESDPGTDHSVVGRWATSAPFVVHTTAPDAPTSVSSLAYPAWGFGEPTGLAPDGTVVGPSKGGFTITTSTDTAAVQYSWRTSSLPIPHCADPVVFDDGGTVAAADGTAYLPVPASLPSGFYALSVRGVDVGGNAGPRLSQPYFFIVAPYVAGATAGSDRLEVERLPLTTSVTTYVTRSPASSGGAERVLVASRPGQRMSFQVEAPGEGRYGLQLAGAGGDHHGSVQVRVDGRTLLDPSTGEPSVVDFYRPASTRVEEEVGSTLQLTAGVHTVSLVTVTPNTSSRNVHDHGVFDHGNTVDLDFIRLVQFG